MPITVQTSSSQYSFCPPTERESIGKCEGWTVIEMRGANSFRVTRCMIIITLLLLSDVGYSSVVDSVKRESIHDDSNNVATAVGQPPHRPSQWELYEYLLGLHSCYTLEIEQSNVSLAARNGS